MKCEWVQQNTMLHVYDELADDARYETRPACRALRGLRGGTGGGA